MSLRVRTWTPAELDALPEDGNTYELIHGALFVTPPPGTRHQAIVEVLMELLLPYVVAHRLGRISVPRSVIRTGDSQLEPDLMVRPVSDPVPERWEDAPRPILIVEVLSRSSKRHDQVRKRAYYSELGIPEYWIVDGDERSITIARPGHNDVVVSDSFLWLPASASEPLILDARALF